MEQEIASQCEMNTESGMGIPNGNNGLTKMKSTIEFRSIKWSRVDIGWKIQWEGIAFQNKSKRWVQFEQT